MPNVKRSLLDRLCLAILTRCGLVPDAAELALEPPVRRRQLYRCRPTVWGAAAPGPQVAGGRIGRRPLETTVLDRRKPRCSRRRSAVRVTPVPAPRGLLMS